MKDDCLTERNFIASAAAGPQQWIGRIAVILAIAVFIGTYVFGIAAYGIVSGIVLGWMPASTAAWLCAVMVAAALSQISRRLGSTRQSRYR